MLTADADKKTIEDYLLYLSKEKNYSERAVHTVINAIKFYYEQVLKKPKEFYDLKDLRNP